MLFPFQTISTASRLVKNRRTHWICVCVCVCGPTFVCISPGVYVPMLVTVDLETFCLCVCVCVCACVCVLLPYASVSQIGFCCVCMFLSITFNTQYMVNNNTIDHITASCDMKNYCSKRKALALSRYYHTYTQWELRLPAVIKKQTVNISPCHRKSL